jgi:ArsR family transcriptional regulator
VRGAVVEPIHALKADLFKACGHPARIRILEVLSKGERAVSELVPEVGLEASNLSQQLGVLRRSNLVRVRREGSTVRYALVDHRLAKLLELAREIRLTFLTEARDELVGVDA